MVCLSSLGVWEEVCNCCFIKFIGKSGGGQSLKCIPLIKYKHWTIAIHTYFAVLFSEVLPGQTLLMHRFLRTVQHLQAIKSNKNKLTFIQQGTGQPVKCQCCPHIETRLLICCVNQLTDLYMRATLAFNGLNKRGCSQVFYSKVTIKYFANFTGKQRYTCNFAKNGIHRRCFAAHFTKFFRIAFLQNTFVQLLLSKP